VAVPAAELANHDGRFVWLTKQEVRQSARALVAGEAWDQAIAGAVEGDGSTLVGCSPGVELQPRGFATEFEAMLTGQITDGVGNHRGQFVLLAIEPVQAAQRFDGAAGKR